MKRMFVVYSLMMISIAIAGQERSSREEYVATYAELAMEEMRRSGIPASITLAQGCLESDNGNSSLAVEGRNHFGIKCHDWTGKKMYHDDDEKDECFRVYRTDEDSYYDHSDFLTGKNRYSSLFELKPDDYKGWAKGLKKAGYATSNKYADLLIRIIEDNELYAFDQEVLKGKKRRKDEDKEGGYAKRSRTDDSQSTGREVYLVNRTEYILAEEGDTWYSLREELDMYPNELYRYNKYEKNSKPDSGMIIYIQPKRWRAEKGQEQHVLGEGEDLWFVSQKYGVRLKCLYRHNRISQGTEAEEGSIIWLRKKKPSEPGEEKKIKEKEEESPVQLEFSDF